MSASKSQHEPSMEEILASIRRIISEDGETTKIPAAAAVPMKDVTPVSAPRAETIVPSPARPATPPPRPTITTVPPPPPPPPASGSPVLELTEMIGDDGKVVHLRDDARPPPLVSAPPPPPPPPPPPQPTAAQVPATVKAVTALQDLQSAARVASLSDAMLVPVGNLGRAFEDLVREQLKPMLQTWIDQNLPSVIERQVQKEIERISREAADR